MPSADNIKEENAKLRTALTAVLELRNEGDRDWRGMRQDAYYLSLYLLEQDELSEFGEFAKHHSEKLYRASDALRALEEK